MAYNGSIEYISSIQPGHYRSNLEYKVEISHSDASPLESAVQPSTHSQQTPTKPTNYITNSYSNLYGMHINTPSVTYFSASNDFLNPLRPRTRFIEGLDFELKAIIQKAFRVIFDQDFPDDIAINICDKERMKTAHETLGGVWNAGILGFAVNRKAQGQINEIFVLNDELDSLLVTFGHELGHVISPTLSNQHNEEAKAFAFQQHWIKTISEHNIGNLAHNFTTQLPAKNGLHDVSSGFIQNLINSGTSAIDAFNGLITGNIKVCA